MSTMRRLVWRIYAGALGAVTTIATQKVIRAAWKFATGDEPPQPGESDEKPIQAAIWILASTLGVRTAQVTMNLAASEHYGEAVDDGE